MAEHTYVLVGTRKGAWILRSNATRSRWTLQGPLHLGSTVYHFVADPRNPEHFLIALRNSRQGHSIFHSHDLGKSWTPANSVPAFIGVDPVSGQASRSVNHVFWLSPGHSSQPGVWYAGCSPQGLFRSDDDGYQWQEVTGLNHHPEFLQWCGGADDNGANGPTLHSIIVDNINPAHLLIGMSSGGIFESWDEGATWSPLNQGVAIDFFPPPTDGNEYLYGHDPHCVVMHPLENTRLYQQNHSGIYRLDRHLSDRWLRIGTNMPAEIGDNGFPMVVHPRHIDTAWVFPMDGSAAWSRTSPEGRPAVYQTRDAGSSWERQDSGFPEKQAWWTVLRQAMCSDRNDPVGLYLGTTNGEVWASFDEGGHWRGLTMNLPQVCSLSAVTV